MSSKKASVSDTPMVVNGYQLKSNFSNLSGFARWDFAVKDGKEWFIKEFLSPKLPKSETTLDPEYVDSCQKKCIEFYQRKKRLFDAVKKSANGTIVTVDDFFFFNTQYYAVSEKVDIVDISPDELAALSPREKAIIFKVIANSFASLHGNNVIHADIRPDNVVFKRSSSGTLTVKIIDFDGSFMIDDPPCPEDLPYSASFVSPEVGLAISLDDSVELTPEMDVFGCGLLFHLFWTGELPEYDRSLDNYPYEAVLRNHPLTISRDMPEGLRTLIEMMLCLEPERRPSMKYVFHYLRKIFDGVPIPDSVKDPDSETPKDLPRTETPEEKGVPMTEIPEEKDVPKTEHSGETDSTLAEISKELDELLSLADALEARIKKLRDSLPSSYELSDAKPIPPVKPPDAIASKGKPANSWVVPLSFDI